MFQAFLDWRKRRRCEKAATMTAIDYFEKETGHHAHRAHSHVIANDEEGFVVRVCHGRNKPPSRCWYIVSLGGEVLEELKFDDVTQYGEQLWA